MEKVMLEDYGNPSSLHKKGREATEILDNARDEILKHFENGDIIFTSGGTESNNLAFNILEKGDHLITSLIEHHSIMDKCDDLKKNGVEVSFVKVDKEGYVDLENLKSLLKENTKLVSIIHANNEIGTIQNLKAIREVIGDILFHSDCVQSFKKEEIKNVDMASISSHKIHGPKGVGALFYRNVKLKPIFLGSQENKKRGGTENMPGIVGFAKAASLDLDVSKMKELRDYLISELSKIEDVKLNGPNERLCNNVNFSFKRIEGESILMHLDLDGIMVSTGSACSSRSLEASHVLLAIGLDHATAHGSIRFSISKYTTKEEIDYVIQRVKEAVKKLREVSPL